METKLTLKLDQTVINSAKEYAKRSNKSLSKMVEDFFRNMATDSNTPEKYPLLVRKLSGVIAEKDLKQLSRDDEKSRYILRESK